jgi:hypothetical protein
MQQSLRLRKPSQLSHSLHSRLEMYAVAASAAGAGFLSLAQPAQAKVVYTPTHQTVGANGVYNLDVNHDGTVDFLVQQWNYGNWSSNNQLLADPAFGNGVQGGKHLAAALLAGASIGPTENFIAGDANGEVMLSITHFTTGGTSYVHGAWANVRNRYLGLKFQIAGKTHYGWARLNVERNTFHFAVALTGYAYETTPDTPIKAGQTTGGVADSSAGTSPKSLGELALGAQNAPARRQP